MSTLQLSPSLLRSTIVGELPQGSPSASFRSTTVRQRIESRKRRNRESLFDVVMGGNCVSPTISFSSVNFFSVPRELAGAVACRRSLVYLLAEVARSEERRRNQIVEEALAASDQLLVESYADLQYVQKALRKKRIEQENLELGKKTERERMAAARKRTAADEEMDRKVILHVEHRAFCDLLGEDLRLRQRMQTLHSVNVRRKKNWSLQQERRGIDDDANLKWDEAMKVTLQAAELEPSNLSDWRQCDRLFQLRKHLKERNSESKAAHTQEFSVSLEEPDVSDILPYERRPLRSGEIVAALKYVQRVGRGYLARKHVPQIGFGQLSIPSRRLSAVSASTGPSFGWAPSTEAERLLREVRRKRQNAFPQLTVPDEYSGRLHSTTPSVAPLARHLQNSADEETGITHLAIYNAKEHSDVLASIKEQRARRQKEIANETWFAMNEIRLAQQEKIDRDEKEKELDAHARHVKQRQLEDIASKFKAKQLKAAAEEERKMFVMREKREIRRLELHVRLRQHFMGESRVEALTNSLQEVPGARNIAGMSKSFGFKASVDQKRSPASPSE